MKSRIRFVSCVEVNCVDVVRRYSIMLLGMLFRNLVLVSEIYVNIRDHVVLEVIFASSLVMYSVCQKRRLA